MAQDQGLNAIDKAVATALEAAAITALVPATRHWNMVVPTDNATWPVIVFGFFDSDNEAMAFSSDGQSMLYTIKAIAKGSTDVGNPGEIAAEIDTVFHRGTLSPTGQTVYGVHRVRHLSFIENDEGNTPYVHRGAVYKIWVN